MKTAIINSWGTPDVFEIKETKRPEPNDDQVLIKVFASSINPVDWKHRLGNHKYMLGAPFPITLGYDVAGEVAAVGNNITRFKIGDKVFGDLDKKYGGGLAEFAVGNEHCFALVPANNSMEVMAAYPLVTLTALQALRDKALVSAGKTVLINGASGGVGHIAVQIATILGASTIAVASTRAQKMVESLNCTSFIDYKKNDVLSINEKLDVFFDVIGNYSFLQTKHLLKPGGIYISTLPRPKIVVHKLLQPFSNGKKVKAILRKHSAADMDQIAQWVEEGKLQVVIDKQFDLDHIAEAHSYSESGKTLGKSVVLIK